MKLAALANELKVKPNPTINDVFNLLMAFIKVQLPEVDDKTDELQEEEQAQESH